MLNNSLPYSRSVRSQNNHIRHVAFVFLFGQAGAPKKNAQKRRFKVWIFTHSKHLPAWGGGVDKGRGVTLEEMSEAAAHFLLVHDDLVLRLQLTRGGCQPWEKQVKLRSYPALRKHAMMTLSSSPHRGVEGNVRVAPSPSQAVRHQHLSRKDSGICAKFPSLSLPSSLTLSLSLSLSLSSLGFKKHCAFKPIVALVPLPVPNKDGSAILSNIPTWGTGRSCWMVCSARSLSAWTWPAFHMQRW